MVISKKPEVVFEWLVECVENFSRPVPVQVIEQSLDKGPQLHSCMREVTQTRLAQVKQLESHPQVGLQIAMLEPASFVVRAKYRLRLEKVE